MINNFIGGGQVFLHKVRMFHQVLVKTFFWATTIAVLGTLLVNQTAIKNANWPGFFSYYKAMLTLKTDEAFNEIRPSLGNHTPLKSLVNASSYNHYSGKIINFTNVAPERVIKNSIFIRANAQIFSLLQYMAIMAGIFFVAITALVVIVWSYFGKSLTTEKRKEGSSMILNAAQVRTRLRALKKASDLHIGKMPLVKDMETRHILVTGSTGSGKTNLLHNLLPQIRKKKQSAIILDQTGEMISKYYDPKRGDIIFNPFDARSHMWDFWQDCVNFDDTERFAKIMLSYQSNRAGSKSDPFWENSAEIVLTACIEHIKKEKGSLRDLMHLLEHASIEQLKKILEHSHAKRQISTGATQTISSILTVLATNIKPLRYLALLSQEERSLFSLKHFIKQIQQPGHSGAWLFLATKPHNRESTLPLLATMTELAMSELIALPIDEKKRLWFIIDELAALKKLPSLSSILSEGRKYGACVVAAMQSLNQLYENYGYYLGSTIFGQFGTNFFFRNHESNVSKILNDLSGQQIIQSQQKNISFGANEFRDGVSYTEHEKQKPLVDAYQLASLNMGEAIVILPEVSTRTAKITVDLARKGSINEPSFLEGKLQDDYHSTSVTASIGAQGANPAKNLLAESLDAPSEMESTLEKEFEFFN
jgi:type IV conjugative transfer system coupling protein TraD